MSTKKKSLEYYECAKCGKPYRTEEQANDCYLSHSTTRRIQEAQPVYQSKIAQKLDRGMKAVRKHVNTLGEISDVINDNFDFDAAFEGFAGGLGSSGSDDNEDSGAWFAESGDSLTGGLFTESEEKALPRKKVKK